MIRRDLKSFFIWVRSSQAPLYAAPIYIVLGILVLGYRPDLHEYIMSFATRLFYAGVMWGQVPGWSGAMPHPVTSVLVGLFEILAAVFVLIDPWLIDFHGYSWQLFLWIASLAHVAQYMSRGLGRTMRTAPNIVTVIGLLYSLTSPATGYMSILMFPLASVYSLLLRVDPARRKKKITVNQILVFALIFLISIALAPVLLRELYLLPMLVLFILIPSIGGGDEIYKIGTNVSKIFALLSFPLSFFVSWGVALHFALIGFLAVTMLSLCTPLLIPGIIWREIPRISVSESYFIAGLGALSAILRFLGGLFMNRSLVMISGILVIIVTIYYVYKILKMPKVSVKI